MDEATSPANRVRNNNSSNVTLQSAANAVIAVNRISASGQAEQRRERHQNVLQSDILACIDKLYDVCQMRMHLEDKTLQQLFPTRDTNHSNDLSVEEFADLFRSAAIPIQSKTHMQRIFDYVRDGNSGGVQLEQLRVGMELHARRRQLADLLKQNTDLAWLISRRVLSLPTDTIASVCSDTSALHERISARVPDIVDAAVRVSNVVEQQDGLQDQKHRQEQKPQQHGSNIKFTAMTDSTDGLIMARFGDVNLYLQLGLVGLVGTYIYT